MQVSIGTEAVDAAEAYLRTGERTGMSAIEQISWVRTSTGASKVHHCCFQAFCLVAIFEGFCERR